jgi:hypothetical protein
MEYRIRGKACSREQKRKKILLEKKAKQKEEINKLRTG